MKFSISALFLFSFLFTSQILEAQCPGCVVDLPQLPGDTVFLADPPDGETGIYYDYDLSFRLPKTTDPVNALDPSIPAGLDIGEIKILALVNLPPGLNYEANQTTFDPSNETDGCVRLCGTPLQPGLYEMSVVLDAKISVLNQQATYPIEIYIAPAASSTDGFSMNNTSGCGEVEVLFENNVPSNGDPGFTYIWDFGNGFTSTLENPGMQIYDEPGTYIINYEAAIDTIPPTLTSLTIHEIDCDDLIGAADIFIRIKDPSGTTVFSTSPIDNTPIPITIAINLEMESGTYKLEVRDEDPFGTADCGNLLFNLATNDTLSDGGLVVSWDILKPIFNVTSSDTIVVFEAPAEPELNMSGDIDLCSNELLDLDVLNYADNIQWYKDSSILFGDTLPTLTVSLAGLYWVEYIDQNGCQTQSQVANIIEIPAPAVPTFSNNLNTLTINNTDNLPTNYSAQWYLDGNILDGATSITYVIAKSGEYTLEITDEDTGCSTSFTFGVIFTSTKEEELLQSQVLLFPNPTSGDFLVSMNFEEAKSVSFEIYDRVGKLVLAEPQIQVSNKSEKAFDISILPEGMYFLRLIIDNELITKRIIKM